VQVTSARCARRAPVCLALAALAVVATPARGASQRSSSEPRFWARLSDPEIRAREALQIGVERMAHRADLADYDAAAERAFWRSVVALARVGGVRPEHSGRLGFFVGHAGTLLGLEPHAEWRRWLKDALADYPAATLALYAWLDLATLADRDGDQDQRDRALGRAEALAVDPVQQAEVVSSRAAFALRRGDAADAAAHYRRAIALDLPERTRALLGWRLALALDRSGDLSAALAAIGSAEQRAFRHRVPGHFVIEDPDVWFEPEDDRAYLLGLGYLWRTSHLAGQARDATLVAAEQAFRKYLAQGGPEVAVARARAHLHWVERQRAAILEHARRESLLTEPSTDGASP